MVNNSILFDFDSIVDKELSTILWIRDVYRDSPLPNFNKHNIMYTPIENFRFDRCLSTDGLFKSLIEDPAYKDRADEVLKNIYETNEEDILRYASTTSCKTLIERYNTAGGGIIKRSVRVDNDIEKKFIEELFGFPIPVHVEKREDTNMEFYTRLVIGCLKNALDYKLDGMSIMVLDFRENFTEGDITCLNPELIIRLGDTNKVSVMSAYIDNADIDIVD